MNAINEPLCPSGGPWRDHHEGTCGCLYFRCKDDPEANGRQPLKGEQRFTLTFPLEDGRSMQVHMGRESMNHFETFIAQMMIDDSEESQ